jgi:hypothetical protein
VIYHIKDAAQFVARKTYDGKMSWVSGFINNPSFTLEEEHYLESDVEHDYMLFKIKAEGLDVLYYFHREDVTIL